MKLINTFLKKYFGCILLLLLFINCGKKDAKSEMINDFVKENQPTKSAFQDAAITLQKTIKSAPNEITMIFSTSISEDQLQPEMIQSALTDLMMKGIKKNPKNLKLLDNGVNFNLQVVDKNGKKIAAEIINKSNMNQRKPDFSNKKQQQLNQLLEISNSNLPITDASGVKLTKIFLGNNNDVIYNAEIPDQLSNMIITEENKQIIRKNMLKDTAFIKMVSQLRNFDITSVKYQYRNRKGKLLQEVTVTQKDFR